MDEDGYIFDFLFLGLHNGFAVQAFNSFDALARSTSPLERLFFALDRAFLVVVTTFSCF